MMEDFQIVGRFDRKVLIEDEDILTKGVNYCKKKVRCTVYIRSWR